MNRSILIVICDFLLVSLLVFSSPDINRVTEDGSARTMKMDVTATNQADSGKDLAAAMRVALDEESKRREQLMAELAKTHQSVNEQEALLNERARQVESYQSQLQSRDQQAELLQQQQASLQQKFTTAQSNIQALNQQLTATSTESQQSRDKLAETQAALRKQAEDAAALQKQMSQLAQSNQAVLAERQQLVTQLEVAEVEKRSATEEATRMQTEVKVEREEKAKLAEGINALASKSGELAQEVHENIALTPNNIFNDIITNRIQASFTVSRPGVFGDSSKHKDTQTILITDGTNTYALCHLQDTPLQFWNPGIDWVGLVGTLSGNTTVQPIHSMSFDAEDPRVVLVPVTADDVRQLGSKVYKTSTDPYKFQDAVLIGARDGYYGECRFQIDLTTPQYVKLDRNFLRGLFGKFNPSSGDLVFSKNGELLGMMVNDTYCLMVHQLDPAATFQFGDDVRAQHTGQTLARLYSVVNDMPFKLQ
jgi:hypothetical protein